MRAEQGQAVWCDVAALITSAINMSFELRMRRLSACCMRQAAACLLQRWCGLVQSLAIVKRDKRAGMRCAPAVMVL